MGQSRAEQSRCKDHHTTHVGRLTSNPNAHRGRAPPPGPRHDVAQPDDVRARAECKNGKHGEDDSLCEESRETVGDEVKGKDRGQDEKRAPKANERENSV